MKRLLEENETLTQTMPPARVSPIYKTIYKKMLVMRCFFCILSFVHLTGTIISPPYTIIFLFILLSHLLLFCNFKGSSQLLLCCRDSMVSNGENV